MAKTRDEPLKIAKQGKHLLCLFATRTHALEVNPHPDCIKHQLSGSSTIIQTQLFQSHTKGKMQVNIPLGREIEGLLDLGNAQPNMGT